MSGWCSIGVTVNQDGLHEGGVWIGGVPCRHKLACARVMGYDYGRCMESLLEALWCQDQERYAVQTDGTEEWTLPQSWWSVHGSTDSGG